MSDFCTFVRANINLDSMKNRILTISVAWLVGLVLTALWGHHIYWEHLEIWKQRASGALLEVLKQEIEKRKEKEKDDVFYASVGGNNVGENAKPRKVTYYTSTGEKEYELPIHKDEHNIASDPNVRGFQTYLFQKYPLSVDSLYVAWVECLEKANLPGKGGLQIGHLDMNTGKVEETAVLEGFSTADSLAYFTVGYFCEIAVTAYAKVSSFQLYSFADGGLLLLCLGLSSMFVWLLLNARHVYRRYLVREVHVEVPVAVVEHSHSRYYKLGDGTIFDRDELSLQKEGHRVDLTAQKAELLWLLIQAKGEALSNQDLIAELWPDGSGNDGRLHQAVGRLNKSLKEVSACWIENRRGFYCLVMGNAPEEKSDIS